MKQEGITYKLVKGRTKDGRIFEVGLAIDLWGKKEETINYIQGLLDKYPIDVITPNV